MKVAAVHYDVVLYDFSGWYPSTHQIILTPPWAIFLIELRCAPLFPNPASNFVHSFIYFGYMPRLLRVETTSHRMMGSQMNAKQSVE
jgi:hypothetical protein